MSILTTIAKLLGIYEPHVPAPTHTQHTHASTQTHVPDGLTYTKNMNIANTHVHTDDGFEAHIGIPDTRARTHVYTHIDTQVISERMQRTPPVVLNMDAYVILKVDWANGMSAKKMAAKYKGKSGYSLRKCEQYVSAFNEAHKRLAGSNAG